MVAARQRPEDGVARVRALAQPRDLRRVDLVQPGRDRLAARRGVHVTDGIEDDGSLDLVCPTQPANEVAGADEPDLLEVRSGQDHRPPEATPGEAFGQLEEHGHPRAVVVRTGRPAHRVVVRDDDHRLGAAALRDRHEVGAIQAFIHVRSQGAGPATRIGVVEHSAHVAQAQVLAPDPPARCAPRRGDQLVGACHRLGRVEPASGPGQTLDEAAQPIGIHPSQPDVRGRAQRDVRFGIAGLIGPQDAGEEVDGLFDSHDQALHEGSLRA
jgi:hypothetical protein